MVLGQMVAISVALALFLTALSLRPASRPKSYASPTLYLPLLAAMATIAVIPKYVETPHFLTNLLWMHGLLLIPLFASDTTSPTAPVKRRFDINPAVLYTTLIAVATAIHAQNLHRVIVNPSSSQSLWTRISHEVFTHPAQASISLDVIWVAIILTCWWLTTGSFTSLLLKSTVFALIAGSTGLAYTGINWKLAASIVPIIALLAFGIVLLGFKQLRKRNVKRRRALMDKMGILDDEVIPGTDKRPPTKSSVKTLVGFFHPYW
jgi:alpha-1,2-mannosyltransferase